VVTARRSLADGLDHGRVSVPERERAIGHHPVDIGVAIGIDEIGAFALLDEGGCLTVVGRAPRRRAAAFDHHLRCPGEQLF
jgi:hypothetical protein